MESFERLDIRAKQFVNELIRLKSKGSSTGFWVIHEVTLLGMATSNRD